jgi:hypothetical protein
VPGKPGVPDDASALRAENGRLEANERLRMLAEDKDAQIAELRERVARLERLVSRNSGNSSMPPLRHEALRSIPGSAGRNSEGGSWV